MAVPLSPLVCALPCVLALEPGVWELPTTLEGELTVLAADPADPPVLRGVGPSVLAPRGGRLVLDGVIVDGEGERAGVVALDAEVVLRDVVLRDLRGPAVEVVGGSLALIDAIIEGVVSDTSVVACDAASCSVVGSRLIGNVAGGDILRMSGGTEVLGSVFCGELAETGSVVRLDFASGELSGNVVANNVSLQGDTVRVSSSSVDLSNNHLVGNEAAQAALEMVWSTVDVRNNLIWDNTANGDPAALDEFLANVTTGYNLFDGNAPEHTSFGVDASDLVDVDPQTVGGTAFTCELELLRPALGSPLIDGGDPTIIDLDGSVSDIGAFGGETPIEPPTTGGTPPGTTPPGTTPPGTTPGNGQDQDQDGVARDDDCDDGDASVYPGASDVPNDGIDQDCSGLDARATLGGVAGCSCDAGAVRGAALGWLGLLSRR